LPTAELKAVDFGNNSMGKEGAYALADLLRGSTTVADVNINMNDVGNEGAFQVCAAVSVYSCLCVCWWVRHEWQLSAQRMLAS
jgi:predicted ABC-type sugar transport system permease subunit